MKIKVEFELTPKEFRESLGLPDLSGLQDEILAELKARIEEDLKNFSLAGVVETWFNQGLAASRKFQEMVTASTTGIFERGGSQKKAGSGKQSK